MQRKWKKVAEKYLKQSGETENIRNRHPQATTAREYRREDSEAERKWKKVGKCLYEVGEFSLFICF